MKKRFFKLAIILTVSSISLLSTNSCDGYTKAREDNISADDYDSYQAACLDNNYVAAHKYLAKLKQDLDDESHNSSDKRDKEEAYNDAIVYVYTQEMLYLIGEGSDESISRVLFLLTEFNQQIPEQGERNKLYVTLIDLALSQDQVKLAEKILLNYQIMGEPITEGLERIYSGSERTKYIQSLASYNNICNKLLDYAINHGDTKLAKKTITMYKPNIHETEGSSKSNIKIHGVKVDEHHRYVEYKWQDKELAQKKYEEAVANGLLKK